MIKPNLDWGEMTLLKALIIILLIGAIIGAMFLPEGEAAIISPHTITDVLDDGFTRTDTGAKDNSSNYLRIDKTVIGGVEFLGWVEWNITEIGDTATIHNAWVTFKAYTGWNDSFGIRFTEYQDQVNPPSSSTGNEIITDVQAGEFYANVTGLNITANRVYTYELEGSATANISTACAVDWFAVGIRKIGDGKIRRLTSSDGGYDIKLTVDTDEGNYTFTIHGRYSENGTLLGGVNMTVHDYQAGSSQEIEINNTRYLGFDILPELFSFPVDSATRRITPTQSETLYLLAPDDLAYFYEFTIRDFTGEMGQGAHLESWRIVNGSELLVERLQINQSRSLMLVYGETYRIIVRFTNGNNYSFGFDVAGSDPTPSISIRKISFSAQAQITFKHLVIEMSRPLPTQLTVNYNDSLAQTNNVSISISTRNGTVVYTDWSANDNHQFNWASANAYEDYVITITIDHVFYSTLSESFPIDSTGRTFSPFPTLTIAPFEFNLFGIGIILAVLGGFDKRTAPVGVVVSVFIAALLVYYGALNIASTLLISVMVLAVIYGIIHRGGTNV